MQNNRPFSPTNPQRTGGILPPLSKYYYGPAVSPDRSPINADNDWNAPNPSQGAPKLPPRPPPNSSSAPPISQWSSHQNVPSQQSKLPGPPPTAPPPHSVAQSTYNPNTYGPMPGARLSPINATWNQSAHSLASTDTSRWGVNYNHLNAHHAPPELKPPLPPRGSSTPNEHHTAAQEFQVQPSQHNDSFEYLRPIAYSPTPSPSITQDSTPPNEDSTQNTSSPSKSHQLPPPPPKKVPLSNERGPDSWSNNLSNHSHEPEGSSQHQHLRLGSEVHSSDITINQQRPALEGPPHVSFEPQKDDFFPYPPPHGQANQLDGQHASEQPRRKDEGAPFSDGQRRKHNQIFSSSNEAHHAQSTSAVLKENKGTAPQNEGEAYSTVDSDHQIQRDNSFYWHSPHSSASTSREHDENQDIPGTSSLLDESPEFQEYHGSAEHSKKEVVDLPEHTTNLYQSALGPYSASALGFGGPSDWEHFGDYDGEEVDDTDLYIRPRSPVTRSSSVNTSILPDKTALPTSSQDQHHGASRISDKESSSNHQHSLQSHTSEDQRVKKGQDGVKNDPSAQNNASSSTQLGPSNQPSDEAPSTAGQGILEEPSPTTNPSTTAYLPQFPFEQRQTQTQAPGGPFHGESRVDEIVASEPQTESKVSSFSDECNSELPHVSLKDQLSSAASKVDNSVVHQETAPLSDRDVQATERIFETSSNIQDQSQSENKGVTSDMRDFSVEKPTNRGSLVSEGSVLSKIKEIDDPYADLDPWGKASLNRYVTMLRDEARASSESEKLNMFKAFTKKEWKLRAVLYGAEDEQENDPLSTGKPTQIQQASTMMLRRPTSKALPALPPNVSETRAEVTQAKSVSPTSYNPSLTQLAITKDESALQSSAEDSCIMVETPGGQKLQHLEEDMSEIYSPGGRPIQIQARIPQKPVVTSGIDKGIAESQPDASKEQGSGTKPAYTPFRYSQGYVDDADQPVDRRASFRPYAALKIEPVQRDQAETAPEPVINNIDRNSLTSTAADRQLDRSSSSSQSQAINNNSLSDGGPQKSHSKEQNLSLDLRRFEKADFDPLIAVLPHSERILDQAAELSDLRHAMDAVPDDFNFIHQHFVAWDAKAKKIRMEHERERQIRQGESEQRIDALFNDDEIGYGDISELESEFKNVEAARKIEEDRAEYKTFVEEVFDAVWTRLHFEIDQINPFYDQYSGLAHETLAGKEMFEATHDQLALAPTMSALLSLHQKLDVRHQKAFEAVLERNRRQKKTEVAPWYTLGNVTKVKQLEKQFEHAEKKAIAEYCKERNARANRLMDVLDQNTLRGVGANQDYMEAVMKAVRRIASGRAFASVPASQAGLGMDEVMKAKTVTAVLASSSEQIVQTFHVADMLLNAADYELSVASARLADAEASTFERLKEERAKEDAKLMRDLQHRLALIREDSRRTNDEIVKLLCFLGVQGGHSNTAKNPPIADAEHEQRLQKALEEAKRRNAHRVAEDRVT
ncbi:MAG: hypothetical protein Q9219_001243 [cf. Caloplaca sp. 3 TL-2023]